MLDAVEEPVQIKVHDPPVTVLDGPPRDPDRLMSGPAGTIVDGALADAEAGGDLLDAQFAAGLGLLRERVAAEPGGAGVPPPGQVGAECGFDLA